VSTIARGVSFGGDLEYVDELTLARSIATRRPYTHAAEQAGDPFARTTASGLRETPGEAHSADSPNR
jgi:hypothetical protein